MTRDGQSGRPEPVDRAMLAPESKPAPPGLDLQSAAYPLTHTYAPGVLFPLRR
jgi:hypothetical protein